MEKQISVGLALPSIPLGLPPVAQLSQEKHSSTKPLGAAAEGGRTQSRIWGGRFGIAGEQTHSSRFLGARGSRAKLCRGDKWPWGHGGSSRGRAAATGTEVLLACPSSPCPAPTRAELSPGLAFPAPFSLSLTFPPSCFSRAPEHGERRLLCFSTWNKNHLGAKGFAAGVCSQHLGAPARQGGMSWPRNGKSLVRKRNSGDLETPGKRGDVQGRSRDAPCILPRGRAGSAGAAPGTAGCPQRLLPRRPQLRGEPRPLREPLKARSSSLPGKHEHKHSGDTPGSQSLFSFPPHP